jgi:hypothetical protein
LENQLGGRPTVLEESNIEIYVKEIDVSLSFVDWFPRTQGRIK